VSCGVGLIFVTGEETQAHYLGRDHEEVDAGGCIDEDDDALLSVGCVMTTVLGCELVLPASPALDKRPEIRPLPPSPSGIPTGDVRTW
jgi:hypothetical protein